MFFPLFVKVWNNKMGSRTFTLHCPGNTLQLHVTQMLNNHYQILFCLMQKPLPKKEGGFRSIPNDYHAE